jgi:hypothetical protein
MPFFRCHSGGTCYGYPNNSYDYYDRNNAGYYERTHNTLADGQRQTKGAINTHSSRVA